MVCFQRVGWSRQEPPCRHAGRGPAESRNLEPAVFRVSGVAKVAALFQRRHICLFTFKRSKKGIIAHYRWNVNSVGRIRAQGGGRHLGPANPARQRHKGKGAGPPTLPRHSGASAGRTRNPVVQAAPSRNDGKELPSPPQRGGEGRGEVGDMPVSPTSPHFDPALLDGPASPRQRQFKPKAQWSHLATFCFALRGFGSRTLSRPHLGHSWH